MFSIEGIFWHVKVVKASSFAEFGLACPSSEHFALISAKISGAFASSVRLILCSAFAVLQTPMLDDFSFNSFALFAVLGQCTAKIFQR